MQLVVKLENDIIYSWKPQFFSYLWYKIIIDNKEYDIPGRDGKYFEDLGTYDDITFNVNFNFKERREYLNKTFRDYKRMIRKSKTLMMMDDSEIFYKKLHLLINSLLKLFYLDILI